MLGHCTGCSAPAPHRCGTCGAPYCSRECQVAGRTTHKFTCSAKVKVGDSSNGKGVFARMAFEVGDELHSEKPLVVFSNRLYTTGSQVLQAAAQAIHDLPENKKELVMNFTDAHSPLQPTALGIARTNAVPLGFSSASDPSAYSGIFAVTCRMNHACKPNARYIWNAQAGCEKVFAMRNITADEEITVRYIEEYGPRSERRDQLSRRFVFQCECDACENPSDQSDSRLAEIRELIEQMPVVGYANQRRALTMSERTLRLMEQEGVNTPYDLGTIHYDAYQMAFAIGNRGKAVAHIRAALECAQRSGDVDSAAKYTSKLGAL